MACAASEKVLLEASGIVDRPRFELSRRLKAFKRRPVDRSRAEARCESPWVAPNCALSRLSIARPTSTRRAARLEPSSFAASMASSSAWRRQSMEGNVASSEHGGVVSVVLVVEGVVGDVVVVELVVVELVVVDDVVEVLVVDVLVVDDVVVVDGAGPKLKVNTTTRLYGAPPGITAGGMTSTNDSETTGV